MHFIQHFAIDVLRLTLWLVILAAVFVPLERLVALRAGGAWRSQSGVDLAYYFISSLLPAAILALPMALLASAVRELLPSAVFTWAQALPVWAKFGLALVVAEFGMYWGHRWSHEIPLLWRFHAVHHSAEHLDWLVNTRAHPVDMVFVRLCGLVPVFALGLAQGATGKSESIAITLATTFWGFAIHANVRWRFGWLEQLIATPAFHHWHHTRHEHIDRNYATMFPWMDRLFGTLHLPPQWPRDYGTETPVAASLPRQIIDPFRRVPRSPDPSSTGRSSAHRR